MSTAGRIVSTREPASVGSRGPLFAFVRGSTTCAWAIHSDVPTQIANQLDRLAKDEPVGGNPREAPLHARRYLALLQAQGAAGSRADQSDGPAFSFPGSLVAPADVPVIACESLLEHNFRGWVPGEIEAGRSPVLAVLENGRPVSVCFCARRSDSAAEAGLETAERYRRRGLGAKVAAAWAVAVRSTGRIPLYSTQWTNEASLGVARTLGLVPYASTWTIRR